LKENAVDVLMIRPAARCVRWLALNGVADALAIS
jgi:hypothetical protein